MMESQRREEEPYLGRAPEELGALMVGTAEVGVLSGLSPTTGNASSSHPFGAASTCTRSVSRQVTHIKHNKSLVKIFKREKKLFIWHFFSLLPFFFGLKKVIKLADFGTPSKAE